MHDAVFAVLDRKLAEALRQVDARAEAAIRAAHDTISPSPDSPFVGQLMGPIVQACDTGYEERRRAARAVVEETLRPYASSLRAKHVQRLIATVAQHFPADQYLALVATTPDVFTDRRADSDKFQIGDYNLQFARLQAKASTASRDALASITLLLDEVSTVAKHTREPLWKALPLGIWRLVRPFLKWLGGLMGAIVIAYVLWYFGLRP